MLGFLDHLQIEGEVLAAAMSWIDSLEQKRGIHLKPAAITKLFSFGDTHQIITTTIAPGYSNLKDLIGTIRMENCQMNCNPILDQQKLYGNRFPGRHIDHDKSLVSLKKYGIITPAHSLDEARQYIEYMKSQGVYFGEDKWEEVLPTEHQTLLRSIEDEIELHASTGRLIAKCNPSPQNNHPEKALYRLGGQWNGDIILGKRLEDYHNQGKFFFTHTFCNDCFERQMKEIENI
jgi:hypothetical protein